MKTSYCDIEKCANVRRSDSIWMTYTTHTYTTNNPLSRRQRGQKKKHSRVVVVVVVVADRRRRGCVRPRRKHGHATGSCFIIFFLLFRCAAQMSSSPLFFPLLICTGWLLNVPNIPIFLSLIFFLFFFFNSPIQIVANFFFLINQIFKNILVALFYLHISHEHRL